MSAIIITNQKKLVAHHKDEHEPYEYYKYEVTPRKDFSQAYICFYEIPPRKYNYPIHYHDFNTEAFYIISGEGLLITEEGSSSIKAGDIVVCPSGKEGGHQLFNSSLSQPLAYVDFDTTHSPDVIHYPHSHKIGIIQHNISSQFYKEEDQANYYEDE